MNTLVIIIILAVFAIEVPYLAKAKRYGEAGVAGAMLTISIIYMLDLIYGWNLPTLREGVSRVFVPVTTLLSNLFI
ncbi:MAG: hypothetical protein ABRQ24_02185 [Syntrophomonadaceae bacterium]